MCRLTQRYRLVFDHRLIFVEWRKKNKDDETVIIPLQQESKHKKTTSCPSLVYVPFPVNHTKYRSPHLIKTNKFRVSLSPDTLNCM